MRFISCELFPWFEKGKFYSLQLIVSIITIKSLKMLIITIEKGVAFYIRLAICHALY